MLGPGKADLLDAIRETGSLSAAGRRMGMSYKRAWQLVGAMNAMFKSPLVDLSRGGAGGGHALVTPEGEAVLANFRALEALVAQHGAERLSDLARRITDPPDGG
jgi:molybdate transport system regulatory protein